jgi:small nuclear ribonucleoprotein (snRNP)-like protein
MSNPFRKTTTTATTGHPRNNNNHKQNNKHNNTNLYKSLASYIKHLEGDEITIELKNGRQVTGILQSAEEPSMNMTLWMTTTTTTSCMATGTTTSGSNSSPSREITNTANTTTTGLSQTAASRNSTTTSTCTGVSATAVITAIPQMQRSHHHPPPPPQARRMHPSSDEDDVKLPPVVPWTRQTEERILQVQFQHEEKQVRPEPTATALSTSSTGTVNFNDPTQYGPTTTAITGALMSPNTGTSTTVQQSAPTTATQPSNVSRPQHLVHVRGSAIRYIHLPEDYTTTIRIHLDRQRNAQQKYKRGIRK